MFRTNIALQRWGAAVLSWGSFLCNLHIESRAQSTFFANVDQALLNFLPVAAYFRVQIRVFDLHQFHVFSTPGILYPKHSLPNVLSVEDGKTCDIACVGALFMVFQVIYLKDIFYADCLCDFQGGSPALLVFRRHLPTSLRAVFTRILAIAAPPVATVSTAEAAAPPVAVENLAAPGGGFSQLSHCSSPPRPGDLPHRRRESRSSRSALQR